jgi:hypothetical protein
MTPQKFPLYIKDRQKKRIGVLVAIADETNKTYAIGHSLCAKTKGDVFNQERALHIAEERAKLSLQEHVVFDIPHSMSAQYAKFASECERYFTNPNHPENQYEPVGTAEEVLDY